METSGLELVFQFFWRWGPDIRDFQGLSGETTMYVHKGRVATVELHEICLSRGENLPSVVPGFVQTSSVFFLKK